MADKPHTIALNLTFTRAEVIETPGQMDKVVLTFIGPDRCVSQCLMFLPTGDGLDWLARNGLSSLRK